MRKSTDYGNTWNPAFRVTPLGYPAIDLSTWGPAIDTEGDRTYIVSVCFTDSSESNNEVYYSVYDRSSNTWLYREFNPQEIYYPGAQQSYPDIATEILNLLTPPITCGHLVFENITTNIQQIVYSRYNPNQYG